MIYKVEDTWSKRYFTYIEADSPEEAEEIACNEYHSFDWIEDDGGEACLEDRTVLEPIIEEGDEITLENAYEFDFE